MFIAVEMATTKASRKSRYSDTELNVLVDNIAKHYVTITSKFTDVVTNGKKNKVWASITTSVNSCGVTLRTVSEIRKKWDDLKSRTKAKAALLKRELSKTGGGKKTKIELTDLERRIIALLGETRIKGVKGAVDTAKRSVSLSLKVRGVV
jgi:hypothetical protein